MYLRGQWVASYTKRAMAAACDAYAGGRQLTLLALDGLSVTNHAGRLVANSHRPDRCVVGSGGATVRSAALAAGSSTA